MFTSFAKANDETIKETNKLIIVTFSFYPYLYPSWFANENYSQCE